MKKPQRFFYGWWIVIAAATIQGLGATLLYHPFGAYFVHLQSEFHWSRTMLSGAFSLGRMEGGILGPFQGWIVGRVGSRTVVHIGVVLFGAGFVLFSFVNSPLTFYLTYLLMALGGGLTGSVAIWVVLTNWFARNRSTVMALTGMGFGLGGLLLPGVAWSMDVFGWRRIAFASGIAIILGGTLAARLIRQAPEKYGYLPDGDSPPAEKASSSALPSSAKASSPESYGPTAGLSARQAVKTRAFWFLAFGHMTSLTAETAVAVHLIPHLVDKMRIPVVAAGAVMALLMAGTLVGQLSGGYFGDRVNKRFALAMCMVGAAIALLILAFAATVPLALLFAVIHGLALGFRLPMFIPIRADYFGRGHFPMIMGLGIPIITLGAIVGPLLAGFMADRLGNYQLAFIILGVMAAVGAVLFGAARKPAAYYR